MLFSKGRVTLLSLPSRKDISFEQGGVGSGNRRLKIVEEINPDNHISCLKFPFLPNRGLDLGISDLPGI